MALSAIKNRITTTGTGASDEIFLQEKENGLDWTLSVFSSSWGDADLQVSSDGTNWGDALDASGVVNFTANKSVIVPGNMYYRLDVNTHAAVITLLAK